MKKMCNREIYASEISEYLGVKWQGKDFYVTGPTTLKKAESGKFLFYNDYVEAADVTGALVISKKDSKFKKASVIHVDNPEISFYKVINEFFMDDMVPTIDKTADVGTDKVSRGVHVGKNSIIGPDVVIGANTWIGSNVVISGNVTIGKNCIIKDCAVIGSEGYHFVNDGSNYLTKPCLGNIRIEDNVLIGSNTSIELPLFDETVVGSNAKIDDLVNIGSACMIGEKVQLAAGSILCHNVLVGNDSFMGAGAVIRDGVRIGSKCIIGIGAVVLSNIEDSTRVAGNPASRI